jgi:polar amino acid transport system substrate-binding protein
MALTGAWGRGLRAVALGLVPLFLIASMPDAAAQSPIACGGFYRVAPGDSLQKIANRAYADGDYRVIFEANREILPTVSQIEVGDELFIPCREGAGPKTRGEALAAGVSPDKAATGTAEATAAAVRPDGVEISFLTGSDFAPFAHEQLPEGGMATELVRLAMERGAPDQEVNITFVRDWSSHLGLLDQGAYDLGFPWYRPDCERVDRLSGSMQARCAQFDFSNPLFEVPIGYYVRSGDPLAGATDYSALFGHRICRPAGYFTFDLDQENLSEPNVSRIFVPEAPDCFTLLMQEEVDVVTLNKSIALAEITRLGLVGLAVEIPALASAQTLHVVAKKGDPEGRAYLDLFNAGLAELQVSGRWFEVVSRHLGAFGISIR